LDKNAQHEASWSELVCAEWMPWNSTY
jgi:hypothetical protein